MSFVNEAYRAWIRTLPCCVCRKGNWNESKGEWENQAAHLIAVGMGGVPKVPDVGNLVPMCGRDHMLSHTVPLWKFEQLVQKQYGREINLKEIAEELGDGWR